MVVVFIEYNILVPNDSYIHNIIKNNTRNSSTDIINSLMNVVILDTRYIYVDIRHQLIPKEHMEDHI